MTLAKSIIKILKDNSISFNTYEQDGKYYTEMAFYSDAGEDFVFSIWHNRTKASFINAFQDYAIDFDPDEHAEMWIDARHSVAGVPQSIRTLIDDADGIKETLEQIAIDLNKVA